MDEKKCKWLSISLFIPRTNWQYILRNAIEPYLNILLRQKHLNDFKVKFNYSGGENIQFALLVPSKAALTVAKQTDRYFKFFFKENNLLPQINGDDFFDQVFMPYPQNTIHYGLFRIENIFESECDLLINRSFNEALIEVFSEDLVDDGMILTFAVYLSFYCYKVIISECPSMVNILSDHYRRELLYIDTLNDDLINEKYNELNSSVIEIFNDITIPIVQDEIKWLNKWGITFFKALKQSSPNFDEYSLIKKIEILFDQQLGFGLFLNRLLKKLTYETILKHRYEFDK